MPGPKRSICSLIVATGLLTLTAAAYAAGGNSPTNGGWCPIGPCTRAVLIEEHRDFTGDVELIAFSTEDGDVCRANDHLSYPIQTTFCFPSLRLQGRAINVRTVEAVTSRTRSDFTEVSGFTSGRARAVRLRLLDSGARASARVTFVRVRGHLLRRVHQDKPFGVFTATTRGCVPGDRFRVRAFDGEGKLLGSDSEPVFSDSCEGLDPLGPNRSAAVEAAGGGSVSATRGALAGSRARP